jgi:molybdopterin/thiamine biosynthesis adenylyltransferase
MMAARDNRVASGLIPPLTPCSVRWVILQVDLDTIDVTNLNRQFFFQKQHVGESKSLVSETAIKTMNPNLKTTAHHGSIMEPKFNKAYFEQFNIVLNALDNIKARNHVNRMCIAAKRLVKNSRFDYGRLFSPCVSRAPMVLCCVLMERCYGVR